MHFPIGKFLLNNLLCDVDIRQSESHRQRYERALYQSNHRNVL